jgi:hypothetical protein
MDTLFIGLIESSLLIIETLLSISIAEWGRSIINADSYAYFGLGARMVSPNINGKTAQRAMADGSIQVLGAPQHNWR